MKHENDHCAQPIKLEVTINDDYNFVCSKWRARRDECPALKLLELTGQVLFEHASPLTCHLEHENLPRKHFLSISSEDFW